MRMRKLLLSVYMPLALMAFSFQPFGLTAHAANEKVFVHTDRDIYVAGENIFFKLYILDAQTNKLSEIISIAYLVLQNKSGILIASLKLKAENGLAYGNIPLPDSLESGTYGIYAYTNCMRNTDEASFLIKEVFVANRFDKDLDAIHTFKGSVFRDSVTEEGKPNTKTACLFSTDKTVYQRREKVILSVAMNSQILNDSARLSVSVSEDVPLMSMDYSMQRYINAATANISSRSSNEKKPPDYLPETKGEILQGKVIDEASKDAVKGVYVFLSIADTLVNLQYCPTDSSGMFRFLLNDYYYGKDAYLSVKDMPFDKKYRIVLQDKFELKKTAALPPVVENPLLKDYILKSEDIVTIQKTYNMEQTSEIEDSDHPHLISNQLYYKPSYRIYPSDFVPLNDFAEIAREIIPPQFVLRKHNDKYSATLADENRHEYMDGEPLIFLDGVYIDNVNQLMKLSSDQIKYVDLVCSRYNCGELVFPGILAVFSKNKQIQSIQPNSSTLHIQPGIFRPKIEFNNQGFKKIPPYQPDFRQLLFWDPDLTICPFLEAYIVFYTSQHTGNYTVRIEGITAGGMPVSLFKHITVQ